MTLSPHTRIGPYEILDLVGAGGMGEVYRARDEKLGREVALKVLPEAFAKDEERLARFEREARAVAALSHPNIVAIHDFANEGGRVYAVMELLDGDTLAERLREGALSQRKAVEIASQIARGLAAAHDKNVTHRDLKPANVFVTRDGHVKVLDFGLARLRQGLGGASPGESAPTAAQPRTDEGTVMGTVGYMSPEQVRGESVDHRSDVFSFGAILCEMLSGSRAFQRDTAAETMTAILKEDPLERIDTLPPGLARIVERCLEKKREERFQSAHDLAFALDSLTRDSGASATIDAPRPRRRMRAFGLASALIASLALGYFLGRGHGSDVASLSYQRLTFQRGTVWSGRFDPTGRGVYYSAAWDGGAVELFSTLPGTNESSALGIADSDVLSVSTRGELAILRKERRLPWENTTPITGTLLRSSPTGAARPLTEEVSLADWTPDGESLAVARRNDGRWSVELPLGTVLHETTNVVDGLRFSPDGIRLAFGEKSPGFGGFWSIVFVERDGSEKRFDTGVGGDFLDLAWSPDGREVWFDTVLGAGPEWRTMSTDGTMRVLLRPPIALRILDVSKDGRVLAARTNVRFGVMGVAPGDDRERDYSWLDSTEIDGISRDGRTLLFTEFGEGSQNWSVFLRGSDRSPAVRLGGGQAFGLSPDGKWALTMSIGASPRLVLLPTGIGEPVELPPGGIVNFIVGSWTPDGKHVVFGGAEKGSGTRYYRQDVAGGLPEPITPKEQEGSFNATLGSRPVSPDGNTLAVTNMKGQVLLYPIGADSRPQVVPEVSDVKQVLRWSPDGRFVYVLVPRGFSFEVQRIEVATGHRTVWKEFDSIDPVGLDQLYGVHIADDEKSYYYTFERTLSDLFLIEGLR